MSVDDNRLEIVPYDPRWPAAFEAEAVCLRHALGPLALRIWRDDETFEVLNGLFENPWGRDVRAARLVAVEFQAQLAGRLEPLKARAARMLERLTKLREIATASSDDKNPEM